MNIVIISQARMNSTRLPGKVLKKVLGKPLLEYHIERLKRVKRVNEIIIATTTEEIDDSIVSLAHELSVSYYRGSEHDVLSRYVEAAREKKADIVIRVTSDCPVIDPNLIDDVIQQFVDLVPNIDYMSNTLVRMYPRGLDVEIFTREALEESHAFAQSVSEREHVTPYIYNNPGRFRIEQALHDIDLSHYRWTVDTPEDFMLIKNIIEMLYPRRPNFSMVDILELFKQQPSLTSINSHIQQKKL